MHPKAILIFLRYPSPGRVKSRLSKDLGPERAAAVYEALLRRTLGVAADFKRSNPSVQITLCYTPAEFHDEIWKAFPGPWDIVPQTEGHLGLRMHSAMENAMRAGARKVLLVGTDIADLAPRDFSEAFSRLREGTAVLGPADDGGFYLIGLTEPCPAPFRTAEWGTSEVFSRTRRLLESSGLRVNEITRRVDVDRPADVDRVARQAVFRQKLSVIVPTLAPPRHIEGPARRLASQLWPGDELIVVRPAGAESSGEPPEELPPNVRILTSPRGRGTQMNAGAAEASGDLLLFLHDDCMPPANFAYFVRGLESRPGCALGCFRLRFQPSSPALDFIAGWANLRTLLFGLPYGDQGLFCRKSTFVELGGYRNRYLMEDVNLVERARSLGKLYIVREAMATSSRRYLRRGILRASLVNHLVYGLYRLGVEEERLYDIYYS